MSRSIFVNLPVKDLEKTKEFFRALGFDFNPQFTDETGAALVIADNIWVMMITTEFYKTFTDKQPLVDSNDSEVLISISAESREEVDALIEKALAAGGKRSKPTKEYGFMYIQNFLDLDGHHWEVVWMDPNFNPEDINQ